MSNLSKKRVPVFTFVMMFVLTTILTFATADTAYAALTPLKDHTTIGYWLGGNGGTNKTLAQMDPRWDVVVVSFIETRGTHYTPALNMDLSAVYGGSEADQIAAFKADIQILKNRGQKVIISCGGQNGVVEFQTLDQAQFFLDGVIAIVDEYGFEGFDVDFEGSSIASMNPDKIGNIVTIQSQGLELILRGLIAEYGDDFIISAAPEYCYVQGGAISTGNFGAFLPVLDAVRDILDYIHPQYYNGFDGDFSWLQPSANAGPAFSHVYSQEGYVRLSQMLITGFVTMDKGTFVGLDPSQVAFGVPARAGAGNGIQPPSVYAAAFEQLHAQYPDFRGVMTWSIGWDESGGNAFINAVGTAVGNANGGGSVTPPTQDAQTPVITSQPTSKTVAVNGTADLTVNASVTSGTLSYQWYANGVAINGATNNTYSAPTATEGTTSYYCVITNTDTSVAGNTTATATTNTVSVTVSDQTSTVAPWSATQIYVGGDQVEYQGNIYQAKWWTQGETPGSADVWELIG